ncbi:MAG: hypothetical protein ACOCPX_04980 [Halapricum sp.]
MSNQQVEKALVKADRWSKVIALFFAMGLFGLSILLLGDLQVSAVIAAFGAVGVRIYVPYHVSVFGEDSDGISSQSYEMTGNYHHGAVGLGLVVASFAGLAFLAVEPTVDAAGTGIAAGAVYSALGLGIAVGALVFVVLRSVLPS